MPDIEIEERDDVTQPVITRQGWGARPAKRRSVLRDTTSPTLHHNGPPTGLTEFSSQEDEIDYLLGVQRFHMNTRKWADIAYNFAFAPSGRVYELRGWKIRSAANGTNKGNSSSHAFLLMIGEGEKVPQLMIDSVRRMRAIGDSKYVKGHRDWKSTACPGTEVYRLIKAGAFEGLPEGDKTEEPTKPIDVEVDVPVEKVFVKPDTSELRIKLTAVNEALQDLGRKLDQVKAALVDVENQDVE